MLYILKILTNVRRAQTNATSHPQPVTTQQEVTLVLVSLAIKLLLTLISAMVIV